MCPLTLTASGWMLLTSYKDSEVEALVRCANGATARRDERQPLELVKRRVLQAREQRYAFAQDLPKSGTASVSILVTRHANGRSVAVAVEGAVHRIAPRKDGLVELMRTRCARLASVAG